MIESLVNIEGQVTVMEIHGETRERESQSMAEPGSRSSRLRCRLLVVSVYILLHSVVCYHGMFGILPF